MTANKCAVEMRAYKRDGATIEQGGGCGGILLDGDELERLIDAETSYYQVSATPPTPVIQPAIPPETHGCEKHGAACSRGDERRARGGLLGELFY